MTTILEPIDGRKSFYGKCNVYELGHRLILKSYETDVAIYDKETNKLTINGRYSMTTGRHINSFLSYLGLPGMNKKQIENYKND